MEHRHNMYRTNIYICNVFLVKHKSSWRSRYLGCSRFIRKFLAAASISVIILRYSCSFSDVIWPTLAVTASTTFSNMSKAFGILGWHPYVWRTCYTVLAKIYRFRKHYRKIFKVWKQNVLFTWRCMRDESTIVWRVRNTPYLNVAPKRKILCPLPQIICASSKKISFGLQFIAREDEVKRGERLILIIRSFPLYLVIYKEKKRSHWLIYSSSF